MILMRSLTILAIALLSTGHVLADNSRHYFEFDLTSMNGETLNNAKTVSYSTSMNGLTLKYGYDVNNWFAIEGHLGSVSEDSTNGSAYTIQVDGYAYLGARFNLRYDNFTFYGLAGAGSAFITTNESGTYYENTYSSAAYGFGMDFYGSQSTAITFSFISYIDSTEAILTTAQIGVKFYFDKPKINHRY